MHIIWRYGMVMFVDNDAKIDDGWGRYLVLSGRDRKPLGI